MVIGILIRSAINNFLLHEAEHTLCTTFFSTGTLETPYYSVDKSVKMYSKWLHGETELRFEIEFVRPNSAVMISFKEEV